MLELIRTQKKELPLAAGCENEIIYSSNEMYEAEKTRLYEEQRYVERMTHSIPFPAVKKMAYFKRHIWGL